MPRYVYIARAVDNQPEQAFLEAGRLLAEKIAEAGLTPIDPVTTPFPGFEGPDILDEYSRVLSDLAWIRRSDALVADLSIPNWPYVGCVCELVYARLYEVPTVVITGENRLIGDRIWLRYHADFVHKDADAAVRFLSTLPHGARSERHRG
jgi:hypothetical protein